MVTYGNSKISTIKIPKGTLLFRCVETPEADFEGVNGCFPPQYNVFFYFSPFVVDGIHWFNNIPKIDIYVTTNDIKIVSLISPSKYTRSTRSQKRQFMISCTKTRKSCLVPRPYDPCFRETFIEKHPSILGWIAIAKDDVNEYKKANIPEEKNKYVIQVSDSRGITGPPELAIYPLRKRQFSDIEPPKDALEFNYQHVATYSRSGTELLDFMHNYAEPVSGKWYYILNRKNDVQSSMKM